jgi:methionyl-tRNA formyltransferase
LSVGSSTHVRGDRRCCLLRVRASVHPTCGRRRLLQHFWLRGIFPKPVFSSTLVLMRIIMMGTGPFAVPTFCELYNTRHSVVGLVTKPLRTHRGKQVEPISTIREVAARHGTPIFDPESINTADSQAKLAEFAADLMVVCDYGQILAPATLAAAQHGGVNLHASLLPKYRGAAPIHWAIYNGDTESGATVIHMTPQLDAGPCIAQLRVAIGPDETAEEFEIRLAAMGAPLVCETIDQLESGRAQPIPQDGGLASRAPRLKKTDGAIDWSRSAAGIKNHIRAMEPWPKTYTFWHRNDGPPIRLILGPASVVEAQVSAAPGTVLEASGNRLVIATGDGGVMPISVQPSGKRAMQTAEFLRGHRVQVGDRFGDEMP